MYLPEHFSQRRPACLHALMRARPLATLIAVGDAGLEANHLPLLLDTPSGANARLCGHVAKANPLARLAAGGDCPVLAIFHGPEAYVSPGWYPGKAENPRVVPTWNYQVVHAHGTLRTVDDAGWLRTHLSALSQTHEAAMTPPWRLDQAPPDYLAAMMTAIVGIEITITQLAGKWKLSQNQLPQNRAGVVQGLRQLGTGRASEAADAIVAAEVVRRGAGPVESR